MKRIRIILIGIFISGNFLVYSASNLGWGITSFSKDTLFLGDTLAITSYLKNYDSQPFNDTVSFSLKINGILNVNPNIFPNPFPLQPVNIGAGDSVPANLIVVITPAYFLVGPDILVVWPKADDGSQAHDSIIKTIIVIDTTVSGMSNESRERLKVFYFEGNIFIQAEYTKISLDLVRIFNLSSQEILNSVLSGNNSIPFNNPPNGIYFAEVNFNSTERRILKIVKY